MSDDTGQMPRPMPQRRNKTTSQAERDQHLELVATLYLQSHTISQIAEQIGRSRQGVSQDLAIIRRRWQESTAINFDQAVNIQLGKLDALEQEAWNEYRRSKTTTHKGRRRTTNIVRPGTKAADKDGTVPTTPLETIDVEQTTRFGDSRYLKIAFACIQERSRLLGLNKQDGVAGDAGKAINGVPVEYIKALVERGATWEDPDPASAHVIDVGDRDLA